MRRVARRHAAQLRRQVGENDVGRTTEELADACRQRRIGRVRLEHGDARVGERRDRHDVDADDATRGADELRRDLQPSARPGAEIDDGVAAADEPRPSLQLRELEGGARAIALLLRAAIERVFAVVHRLSPSRRRGDAPPRRIHGNTRGNFLPFVRSVGYTSRPREGGGGAAVAMELNDRQREAVGHGDGPLLVLAGAGSGKTRVITARIARLVECGVAPDAILALTFTNKAAAEMRARVARALDARAADVWLSTFHSAAATILRRHAALVGYAPSFSIYDDQDRAKLIRQCMEDENVSEQTLAPTSVAWSIDQAKNDARSPEDVAGRPAGPFADVIARIYRRYQRALERQNALDFGDLILLVVRLFREHPEARARYQRRAAHLLVDEYQDTNHAQYLLLRLLAAGEQPNVCVVGDDDQSIYGWRGAQVRNILDFEHDFPSAHVVRLEQNYRSTKTILAAT